MLIDFFINCDIHSLHVILKILKEKVICEVKSFIGIEQISFKLITSYFFEFIIKLVCFLKFYLTLDVFFLTLYTLLLVSLCLIIGIILALFGFTFVNKYRFLYNKFLHLLL